MCLKVQLFLAELVVLIVDFIKISEVIFGFVNLIEGLVLLLQFDFYLRFFWF